MDDIKKMSFAELQDHLFMLLETPAPDDDEQARSLEWSLIETTARLSLMTSQMAARLENTGWESPR